MFISPFHIPFLKRKNTPATFLCFGTFVLISFTTQCIKLGEDAEETECISRINSENITYTEDIKPLFQIHCTSCHGATPTQGAATSYNTKALLESNFTTINDRINLEPGASGIMPPSGKMDICALTKLKRWKELGFLNGP